MTLVVRLFVLVVLMSLLILVWSGDWWLVMMLLFLCLSFLLFSVCSC